MRILITGVHGFVGTNLVKALSKEHTIYGLDIVSPRTEGVRQTFSWEGLGHGLPEVDAIIHLAGIAHDTDNRKAMDEYLAVNTELTRRIYGYFLESGTRSFVFFSTVKAVADSVEGAVLDERAVPCPRTPYGISKLRAEEAIARMAETYEREHPGSTAGKRTYVLRPCVIYGPGNKGNLSLLYGVVSRGIPWPLGAFDNRRSMTSVENVSFVVDRLLDGSVEGGTYVVCDDEAVSTNELVGIICEAAGRKARIWRTPRALMRGAAVVGGWLHLPLDTERLRKLTGNYVCSNARIKAALGVDRLPVKSGDGLLRSMKTFGR